jgi:hypothetical protein
MSEATLVHLTFALPDEEDDYAAAKEGPDLRRAVQEFRSWLAHRLAHDELSQAEFVTLEDVSIHMDNGLADYGVDV